MQEDHYSRFWDQFDKSGECWLWTGYTPPGHYGRITIDGQQRFIHRLALELTIGRPLCKGEYALHDCDVKHCGNPDHLYVGTAAENTRDMMKRGRHRTGRGEARSQAKLTDEKVRAIRRMLAAGERQRDIAEAHDVGRTAISAISTGRTWSHVVDWRQ